MGQKVNQTIFRAGTYSYEYNQKYLEKNKEESSLILYTNLEIINYINIVFKTYDMLVHTCKLEYTSNSLNIIIYFFSLNSFKPQNTFFRNTEKKKTSFIISNLLPLSLSLYIKTQKIKIKTKNLNKIFEQTKTNKITKQNLKIFKKILRNKSYKDLIKVMFITNLEKNSSKLLSEIIAIYINKYPKKHYYLISLLKQYFNILISCKNSKVKGLKVSVSGRINGAPRAKTLKIKVGAVPLQSLKSSINYYNATSYTSNGSFGIKVWICEK